LDLLRQEFWYLKKKYSKMRAGWVLQACFGASFWNTKSPDISEPFGDLFMMEV
jgi:hypothetical protein